MQTQAPAPPPPAAAWPGPQYPPPSSDGGRRAGGIILVVVGAIVLLLSLGLLTGGGVLLGIHLTQRDAQGFYTSPTERLEASSYAITTRSLDVGAGAGDWVLTAGRLGTVRIDATSVRPGRDVFVGIASTADVDTYLAGVAHDEIASVHFDPFRADYTRSAGSATPAPPTGQSFWKASASGSGRQTLTWDVSGGSWTLVVMNKDASPAVAVDARVSARTDLLLWFGIGLLVAGVVFLAGGIALVIVGGRLLSPPRAPAYPVPPQGPPGPGAPWAFPATGPAPAAGPAPPPGPAPPAGPPSPPTA